MDLEKIIFTVVLSSLVGFVIIGFMGIHDSNLKNDFCKYKGADAYLPNGNIESNYYLECIYINEDNTKETKFYSIKEFNNFKKDNN